MEKIITKIYSTSKKELLIASFGLMLFSASTVYLLTYMVKVS